ncbi:LacI family DNA-binding transcriptional regulator [Specibacter sp. NPDC057265]|uniref:LacI family DNA-binding transcriptional regulator n=1 Tax=Specibacter sp. NPDC057265 TaxID=3346075 RepID=UPI0036267B95
MSQAHDTAALSLRRPTIIDVARHAGVSKSLASRALRGDPGVSSGSRERVQQAAQELAYRLNSAARSLVRGVSGLIGVVLNEIGNQHHTGIVAGVEAHARSHNASVIISHGGNSPAELSRQIDTLIELRVDGLVIVSSWVPHHTLERAGREVPTVVVTQIDDPPGMVDTIASDDVAGAVLAVEHLIAAGRKRIAYLTRSASATSRARIRGVRQAAASAGVVCEVHELAHHDAAGLRALVTGRAHDAMLCNNDLTAAEVIRIAREAGIAVPGELALIGYDNTPLAELVFPSLSSVNQPQYRMGERAGAAITERLAGREQAIREFHAPALVLRASTPA